MTHDEQSQAKIAGCNTKTVSTCMRIRPKFVFGHRSDPEMNNRIAAWARATRAWHDLQDAHLCRFEEDICSGVDGPECKTTVERCFGLSLDRYDLGRLDEAIGRVKEKEVSAAAAHYAERYDFADELASGGARHVDLRFAIRQEIAMRSIFEKGHFAAYTVPSRIRRDRQLSSFACQRLMADGCGFARDGDALIAALVRALKVMGVGLPGGTTFMEPHIEHLSLCQERVLSSRSSEVCETISAGTPIIRICPSGLGRDDESVKLVFNAAAGPAFIISLVALSDRFRLVVGEITAIERSFLPHSHAAQATWTCKPDDETARAAWVLAGGGNRIAYCKGVTAEMLRDFARLAGMEIVTIDRRTELDSLEEQLRIGECWYSSTLFLDA